jgi:hypothetical protein
MFRNRTANLGLSTQLIQPLSRQGAFFVISVFVSWRRPGWIQGRGRG